MGMCTNNQPPACCGRVLFRTTHHCWRLPSLQLQIAHCCPRYWKPMQHVPCHAARALALHRPPEISAAGAGSSNVDALNTVKPTM